MKLRLGLFVPASAIASLVARHLLDDAPRRRRGPVMRWDGKNRAAGDRAHKRLKRRRRRGGK